MAGILVYLPGFAGADVQPEFERLGLTELLDRSVTAIATPLAASGPDGGSGKLVTFDAIGLPDTPRYVDLNTQEWRAAPPDPDHELPAGRYWLGYVKAAKPTPVELQRSELCDGDPVVLRDGNRWVIPIEDYLPRRLTIDPTTGHEVRAVPERHREFANWTNALFELFLSDGFTKVMEKEVVITIPRGLSYAALALAKNYRVNLAVVDLLELIEDYEAFEIAKVATGIGPAMRACAEKKSMELPSRSPAGNSTPTSTAGASNGQLTPPPSMT